MPDAAPHRVAVYFAPPPGSGLERDAAAWLGRSPWPPADTKGAEPAGMASGADTIVSAPRRYGFHATLKAPFRLAPDTDIEGLRAALRDLGESVRAVTIPALTLSRLGPFFALTEAEPADAMMALAGNVVRRLEPFRAALTEAELARRRQARLDEREAAYLERYGYPYVLDAFRFHLTLTGPIDEPDRDAVEAMLEERFAGHLGRPCTVDALTLFVEPEPGAPFIARARYPFAG